MTTLNKGHILDKIYEKLSGASYEIFVAPLESRIRDCDLSS